MPDSVMTEMKELPSDKEHLLDDIRATVGDTSWFPDANQLVTESMGDDLAMGSLGHDMKFDDMPPLETFPAGTTAPYTSPIHSSFLDGDSGSKGVLEGPPQYGVVGLHNLGNTCFLNAGLQCLNSNSGLIEFFLEKFDMDESMVRDTLTGAVADVIRRMWSGQYVVMHPNNFKHVLATYHPQFKDFRQHDCQEFLALLLDSLHEQLNVGKQWHSNKLNSSPPRDSSSSQSDDISVKSESNSSQSDPAQPGSPASPPESTASGQSQLSQIPPDAQSSCVSEDSNQSESSLASDVTITAEDMNRRLAPIPESLKRRNSGEDYVMDEQSRDLSLSPPQESEESIICDEGQESEGSFTLGGKRLPSIEDFYMKGTKTLNTNVLASEFNDESVTMNSDKFHKPDNVAHTTDPYENLSDFLISEVKGAGAKPLKETNLLANVRDKFSDDYYTKKCLFSEMEKRERKEESGTSTSSSSSSTSSVANATTACSINNIKRIKIDEDEKNIRMQAKLKVNTNKNPTKDNVVDLKSPGGSAAERGQSSRVGEAGGESSGNSWLRNQEHWETCLFQANRAWAKHKECNQSVVVDTFQGQFKSTVVCSECHHVSVTYEPFMYLSVPLPHAMERQMSVVFVPCDTRQPIRYLLTLHKHDNIKKVKLKLRELTEEESSDIIVAEVLDNHIARILEDNTLLKYVNESSRTIYAFEMLPPPQIEEITLANDDASTLTGSLTSGSDDTLTGPNNLVSSVANNVVQSSAFASSDVFSGMGTFAPEDGGGGSGGGDGDGATIGKFPVINNQNNTRLVSSLDSKGFEGHSILNNLVEQSASSWADGGGLPADLDWQDNLAKASPCTGATGDAGKDCNATKMQRVTCDDVIGEQCLLWKQGSTESDVTSGGDATWGLPGDVDRAKDDDVEAVCGDVVGGVTTDQWKSCAICLDEMADRDLMVHTACGGTLCQGCLEMSYEHYGQSAFLCPVCSSLVSPTSDFLQLNAMADYKPKTRILPVPIVQRCDTVLEDGSVKGVLFGHPSILYLPSHMSGEFLYETVDRVVPCLVPYTIHLTDGQGYHCSRCMYTAHCSGCEISRDCEVTLQPGDHLAVHFAELAEEQVAAAQRCVDHYSMKEKRPDSPLTLTDCFNAFMDSEVLDKHNPWFCPCCKKNQCANKTMSVWRYPQTLVVYLKRFVFHELTSTKIDSKVVFPLDNMDLNEFNAGPKNVNLIFDLHSAVCHFGGVNAGHYTAYAKNPHTLEWYYYNDETITKGAPGEDDFTNTYILFYQLQGSGVKLDLTPKKFPDDSDVTMAMSASPISRPAYQSSTLNNDAICQFLDELDSGVDTQSSQQDSQATLDFYS